MMPLLPGGENGGASVLAMELIRHLGRIARECEFVVAALGPGYDELAPLEAANIRRIRMDAAGPSLSPSRNRALRIREMLGKWMPAPLVTAAGRLHRKFSEGMSLGDSVLGHLNADVLFCPFTRPSLYHREVPAVSIVHDLQHRYYPEFFTAEDLRYRDESLRQACRLAARIVCISQYVRNTLLESEPVSADRVEVIPILLPHRFPKVTPTEEVAVLSRFGLVANQFLLYPANFWQHKNHRRLLAGFQIFLERNRDSSLRLVLTGSSPVPERESLRQFCDDAHVSKAVVFSDYLPERDLGALMQTSKAIIFPSLFEGFGMPLVEGMAYGKPLLVSNTTSLPEIGGDAPLYFDPQDPNEIAAVIERLEYEPGLPLALSNRSTARLRTFGGPEEMAARYLDVFRAVTNCPVSTQSQR